jgi:hypothetical protein
VAAQYSPKDSAAKAGGNGALWRAADGPVLFPSMINPGLSARTFLSTGFWNKWIILSQRGCQPVQTGLWVLVEIGARFPMNTYKQ